MTKSIRFITTGLMLGTLAVASSTGGLAQSRVGTTAAPFLTLGAGAKGQSLGHAYTTLAVGADAIFWNSAGAARNYQGRNNGSAFFTHHEWLADINYNAAAVVVPAIGSGVVGLSLASVDYGDMDVRTVARPNGTGETFSASDLSIGLTYAQPLTHQFYFGGTVKYIRQSIRDMSASGAAFDLGFVLETTYLTGLTLAASIQNFGGKLQMSGVNGQIFVDIDESNSGNNPNVPASINLDNWDMPLSFKFGMSLPVVTTSRMQLLVMGDANQSNDNNLNSDVGAQLHFGNGTFNLDLRAGYKDLFLDNVDSHLTFGAGIDVRIGGPRFGFDYAYTPFELLGKTQMVDFRIYF